MIAEKPIYDFRKDKINPKLVDALEAVASYLEANFKGAFKYTGNSNIAFIADSFRNPDLYKKLKVDKKFKDHIHVEFSFTFRRTIQITAVGIGYNAKTIIGKESLNFLKNINLEFRDDGDTLSITFGGKTIPVGDTPKTEKFLVKKTIEESVGIPGTSILLEKGDKVFYEDDLYTSLRKLDAPEKEINLILDGCKKNTVWNAIRIGQAFRGDFLITFEGDGTVGLYDPNSGVVIAVAEDNISITTDEESFEFGVTTSEIKSAIKRIEKELRW